MPRLETLIPPPVWALVVAVLMAAIDWIDLGPDFAGAWRRPVGALIGLVALMVAGWGIIQFARAETTVNPHRPTSSDVLVTDGVYRITRNPMYVGLCFILVGWGIVLGDLAALVVGPTMFVLLITRFQILPEERALRETFGKDYERFCQHTRRWL